MPELPEVETVVRFVRPFLVGRQITKAVIPGDYQRVLHDISLEQFNSAVTGKEIRAVTRRAKFIVCELTQGAIAVHLRMTGRLIPGSPQADELSHVRVIFELSDGSQLYFKDVRKFGRVYLLDSVSDLDRNHGVEPLSEQFDVHCFKDILGARSRHIKPLLLDQKLIAGLGNIYVDEALWQAKIHPLTKSDAIRTPKLKALHSAIRAVLQRSIELNGTTFQSFYYGEQSSGEFSNELSVFGKQGQPCARCNAKIVKTRVAQRGTHICPRCQRAPRGG